MRAPVVLALIVLLVGCVTPAATRTPAQVGAQVDILPAFAQQHDHADGGLHREARGLAAAAYHALVPGDDAASADKRAWLNSEIIVRGHFAFVGYLGAPWLMAIVDLSDAKAPKLISTVDTANAWAMDMSADDAGDFVYVSVYPGAIGTIYEKDYVAKTLAEPSGIAGPGVAVVDARDKAHPSVTGFLPVHGLGPHTAVYHKYPDGREVVFANKADVQGGNGIVVADVVSLPTGGKTLKPLTFFMLDNAADSDFPHDVDVQIHPITGKTLLYGAWWMQGLVILDVSDPSAPTLVSRTNGFPQGEEINVHDVHAYPALVGGKHYTITAPEIPTGQTSGHVRVWDTTDPAHPKQVSEWLMRGDYVVDQPFSFSTHNFVFQPDGTIALAHGHAGVWILDWKDDITAPKALAYYAAAAPGAKPPSWAPVEGAPWFWGTAIDERGLLWALDTAGGLVQLVRSA